MKIPRSVARLLIGLVVTASTRADPTPPLPSFLRSIETAEKLSAIQTSSVEYRPANGTGPTVWLVGVSHLGTADYYQAIQRRLDAQTVVLFEGVGLAEQMKEGPGAARSELGIQKQLSDALGLAFQLDALDYRRPHFINSDLPVEGVQQQVRDRAAATGGAKSSESFAAVMQAIQGSPEMEEMLKPLLSFLTGSPEMRETTRLMLIEVLGRAGEMLELAKNFSPEMKDLFEVLLTDRNAIVMRDLRTQLARLRPEQSVAIFYGAAHMPQFAQHLRDDLRYTPRPEQWDTAFTADPAKSTITPAQLRLVLDMVRAQLPPGAATSGPRGEPKPVR